jgi:ribosomal protein S18 acetylase RimI-like enzyme
MGIEGKEIRLEDKRVVTFRRATPGDEQFLLGVYGSTRQDELALTNWDDAQRDAFVRLQFDAQQTHYRQYYPEGEHLIILVDGAAVGRLYVANLKEKREILDITILPQHRSAGIGTPIIRELMAEAALLGKPLQIYVESFNRSLGLFERLGFVRLSQDGYNALMVWKAL